VCVCVCVSVYLCVYFNVCQCVSVFLCVLCMGVCVCVYVCVCVFVSVGVYRCMCVPPPYTTWRRYPPWSPLKRGRRTTPS
jgi:hypothetical protein